MPPRHRCPVGRLTPFLDDILIIAMLAVAFLLLAPPLLPFALLGYLSLIHI